LFYVVGRPVYDKLELFPKHCRKGNTLNRVFTCTDFRGLWPVGVSSVTIAPEIRTTPLRSLLIEALKKAGINQPEMHDLTMQELDLNQTQAVVLNAGNCWREPQTVPQRKPTSPRRWFLCCGTPFSVFLSLAL
jgi:hypothetical protein